MKTLALIVILVALAGCGKSPKDPTFFFYGDSITAGMAEGLPNFAMRITTSMGYSMANEAYGATSLFKDNAQGGPNIYSQVMNGHWREQDIVMITPGMNDAIIFGNNPENMARYSAGMDAIMAKIIASPVKTVYIGTTIKLVNDQAVHARFVEDAVVQTYVDLTIDAVQRAGSDKIKIIDFRGCFNDRWEASLDGIHPNKQGYVELTNCFESLK